MKSKLKKETLPLTLRTIAESPHKEAPGNKTITGGFWLLFVDRHRAESPARCHR